MSYKLLALDMDGTLLSSNKTVLPRTCAVLEELASKGVPLAYCTGRNRLELLDWPSTLPFIRYGVLASGAIVHDFGADETLGVRSLDAEVLVRAMQIADAEEHMTHVMAIRESVVRPSDIVQMERFGMGVYQGMFENICTREDDLVAWVRANPGQVVKLNFYHVTPDARDRTRERIAKEGLPLTLANAERTSVECSALGVSKAQGLAELAHALGVGMDQVVAIGDSENDAEALGAVGMPVAMGNASPAIKEMAKLVVADNDHDGIAEAVTQLF